MHDSNFAMSGFLSSAGASLGLIRKGKEVWADQMCWCEILRFLRAAMWEPDTAAEKRRPLLTLCFDRYDDFDLQEGD